MSRREIIISVDTATEKVGKRLLPNGDIVYFTIEQQLKVGDTVQHNGGGLPATILCIQGDGTEPNRHWVVVAYKTDIPRVYLISEVTRCAA